MSEAARRWPQTLERRSHAIGRRPDAQIPPEASEDDLMESLDADRTAFRDLGLRVPDELRVVVHRTVSLPRQPGALSVLVSGLVRCQPVEIRYAGRSEGEPARWRRVLPLGLDRRGERWRLRARDLDDATRAYPARDWALGRILEARAADPAVPRAILHQPR